MTSPDPGLLAAHAILSRRWLIPVVAMLLTGACRLRPTAAALGAPRRTIDTRLRDLEQLGYAAQADDASWSLTAKGRRAFPPIVDAFRSFAA